MERQKHGLDFQEAVVEALGYKSNTYSAKFDARKINDCELETGVSVKYQRFKADLSFGDIERQLIIDEPFELIAGFWQHSKYTVVEFYHIMVCPNLWQSLFGDRFIIQEFQNYIKFEVQQDATYRATVWKKRRIEFQTRYNLTSPVIKMRPKVSNSNKRLQCAINYKDFIEIFTKSNTNAILNVWQGKCELNCLKNIIHPNQFEIKKVS